LILKKLKLGQTDRFQFGSVVLRKKPVQTCLTQFFPVLTRFFPGFFGLDPVRFFKFFAYKTKTEPNRLIFQNFNRFNRFFYDLVFSIIFFYFLDLINFLFFLLTLLVID